MSVLTILAWIVAQCKVVLVASRSYTQSQRPLVGRKLRTMDIYLEYQVPFCRPFNCSRGAMKGVGEMHTIWSCLPQDCRTSMIVLLSMATLLAMLTITSNMVILAINFSSKTRRMRKRNPTMNNYSVYVFSLAVADLLMGLIVLPLCLLNFYIEFMLENSYPLRKNQGAIDTDFTDVDSRSIGVPNEFEKGTFNEKSNGSDYDNILLITTDSGGRITVQILGVFTHLTLFVSLYTLIAASTDRLYAAKYSAHYVHSQMTQKGSHETNVPWLVRQWRTTRRSSIAVGWVWAFGILFAVAPLLLNDKVYFRQVGHIFSAMMSRQTFSAVIHWYLATLILPLVGIWVLNVLICLTLWRRKAQLGIKRRRSLRRDSAPEVSVKLSRNITPKNSVRVKPSRSSKRNEDSENSEIVSHSAGKTHQRDRSIQKAGDTLGSVRSPRSRRTLSRVTDRKNSMLRRKVSSLRRAKEMMQRRSSESNITKTLCMVVAAFTVTVLPLVVSLSSISVSGPVAAETLNKEVTALTVSLLLLFSNSVINCVIYGARMRDFRSALTEHTRTFCDKLRNILCGCCLYRKDAYSSEIVNGVFIVSSAKHHKSASSRKSSRAFGSSTLERLRFMVRPSSKKSSETRAPRESCDVSSKDSFALQCLASKSTRPGSTAGESKKAPRPSSSGYRTDPETPSVSVQEEQGRKRLSERYEIVEVINEIELEQSPLMEEAESTSAAIRPASLALLRNQRERTTQPANSELAPIRNIRYSTSLEEARKISAGAAEEYTSLFDYGNRRDSRVISPADACLGIDFSQFEVQ